MACFLHVMEQLKAQGYTQAQIADTVELWHHNIDGKEGSTLMDWPCTEDYCRKVAALFGFPIYYSWRVGGFERELLKENAKIAPVRFEVPGGEVREAGGKRGKVGTRRKFPQVSHDLRVRWCSPALKIDVMAIAINNQKRFRGKRSLVVTGERGEEGGRRASYEVFEPHRTDNRNSNNVRRHVDHWRPILDWMESQVWAIIEDYKLRVHPAYYLGFTRVSCMACIYMGANELASLYLLSPGKVDDIADLEEEFGVTIKRKESIRQLLIKGKSFLAGTDQDREDALSEVYTRDLILKDWITPAGAMKGRSCGPT
ncbi:MAG: phosphoadenosine phosphosulfate reductase family protein [Bacteroidota bacterium]